MSEVVATDEQLHEAVRSTLKLLRELAVTVQKQEAGLSAARQTEKRIWGLGERVATLEGQVEMLMVWTEGGTSLAWLRESPEVRSSAHSLPERQEGSGLGDMQLPEDQER